MRFRDHRRLFVGDSLGRIFSWTVSDNLGKRYIASYKLLVWPHEVSHGFIGRVETLDAKYNLAYI